MSEDRRIGAAIDVGSNSVHLLVVAIEGPQRRVLRDELELLGLGAVVDMEGRIPDEVAAAAVGARERLRADRTRGRAPTGSSCWPPSRCAGPRTGRTFCDLVQQATGLPLHVLSHEEEAGLTVLGVLDGEPPSEPTLVLDIGGGSSELVAPGARGGSRHRRHAGRLGAPDGLVRGR